jgi:hypothetical protein
MHTSANKTKPLEATADMRKIDGDSDVGDPPGVVLAVTIFDTVCRFPPIESRL